MGWHLGGIAPGQTIAIVGVLIDMINSTKFQDPDVYLALSLTAHHLLVRDFGPNITFSGSIHSLMCHGHLYIRYAQGVLGVPLGFLTENTIEIWATNKINVCRLKSRWQQLLLDKR